MIDPGDGDDDLGEVEIELIDLDRPEAGREYLRGVVEVRAVAVAKRKDVSSLVDLARTLARRPAAF